MAGISPESEEDRAYLIQALTASKEKTNPSILVLVAGLQAQNGAFADASDTINLALKKRPKVTGYILTKANLLMSLGDEEETLKWFEKSSRKHRNNMEVRLAEAKYLIKINQSELGLRKTRRYSKEMAIC